MGRKRQPPPIARETDDGFMETTLLIPKALWSLASRYIEQNHLPGDARHGLQMFIRETWLAMKGGSSEWLSELWAPALSELMGEDPTITLSGLDGMKPGQLDALHMSPKTKSGYVGVYSNGKGFRAVAWVDGIQHTIGTAPTAVEAATRRMNYYRGKGLPYGPLEDEMQLWRGRDAISKSLSERVLIEQILAQDMLMNNTRFVKDAEPRLAVLPPDSQGGFAGAMIRANGHNHETGLPLTADERRGVPTHSWLSIVPTPTTQLSWAELQKMRDEDKGLVDPAHAVGCRYQHAPTQAVITVPPASKPPTSAPPTASAVVVNPRLLDEIPADAPAKVRQTLTTAATFDPFASARALRIAEGRDPDTGDDIA